MKSFTRKFDIVKCHLVRWDILITQFPKFENHKFQCTGISFQHLQQYQRADGKFLKHMIIGYDIEVHHITLFHNLEATIITNPSKIQGLAVSEEIDSNCTVRRKRCVSSVKILLDCLWTGPGCLHRGTILLQFSTLPTYGKLDRSGLSNKVGIFLLYPPLSHPNYHIFGPIKWYLSSKQFYADVAKV